MNTNAVYWLELCDDDLMAAKTLFYSNHFRHMSLFCHMIIEKALKAVIADKMNEIPPKIHHLPKLAAYGGIFEILSDEQLTLLDQLTPLQIESRYPESKKKIENALTAADCEQMLSQTEEFLCWIKKLLEK